MSDGYVDDDAPPLGDDNWLADVVQSRPGTPDANTTALCIALNRLAKAIEGRSVAPANAPTGPPAAPPGVPSAPPGGSDTQVKRGKKIYAICMSQSWDIADIGQRVTGRSLNPNSQKWAEADQIAVLDAFKEWNVG